MYVQSFKETLVDTIILTKFQDVLRPDPNSNVTDSDPIGTGIMWHNKACYCLEISATDTHYRLVCKGCGTILIVPNEFNTYGKLRQWCAEQNAPRLPKQVDSWGEAAY